MPLSSEFVLDHALKAQQWERAKGELRALVALQGSYASTAKDTKWERLEALVDNFINEVEGDALQE